MLIQYSWNDDRLRDIWNKLYTDNPYLFPFSSWEYTKEVCSYKKIKPTTLLQKEYIFVYYNHDVPLMIMPLFIKKKKLYIFGENISGPDNLDFIYDKNIRDEDIFLALKELKEKFHLKYNYSVLYAPSWENNEKEDDFVRALASLNVNLLIKQAHWPDAYDQIINNICQMRKLHENKYDNLYYIEPEESIMTALELCDMVVSDESSVMSEAVMFGKPSVAVTDWLIPDTVPSRFASVPMNYVLKCKKVELREYVTNLAAHSTNYNSILEKGKLVFSNQGNCCNDILDAIDYFYSR